MLMGPREAKHQAYQWRHLSQAEREQLLDFRKRTGLPWHGPPHFAGPEGWYLISAANCEHRAIMASEERRAQVQRWLLDGVQDIGGEVTAWVVLANHYHILARLPSLKAFGLMARKMHSCTAVEWNRVDRTPGRCVWYRYGDRQIRGEGHYYATLNYIHGNPVRHGYVDAADAWACTSLKTYLDEFGREYLRDLWDKYPPLDMGKGWDDV